MASARGLHDVRMGHRCAECRRTFTPAPSAMKSQRVGAGRHPQRRVGQARPARCRGLGARAYACVLHRTHRKARRLPRWRRCARGRGARARRRSGLPERNGGPEPRDRCAGPRSGGRARGPARGSPPPRRLHRGGREGRGGSDGEAGRARPDRRRRRPRSRGPRDRAAHDRERTTRSPTGLADFEVVRWLARGKSNREIGELLTISPRTVQNHVAHVYDKLGLYRGRAGATLWAVERGLLR